MNDKIAHLLEQLAIKLGTTAEYLWKVLLIQAKISAYQSLAFIIFLYISGFIMLLFHRKFMKIPDTINSYNESIYDKSEFTCVIMGILSVVWIILFIIHFFAYGNMMSGLFNPQYWALDKILDSI